MPNESIKLAFERMWQHMVTKLGEKADINHNHSLNDLPDICDYINEAIYGVVDGTIENISNAKATYIREYGFYKHPSLISASFANVTKVKDYAFYQCPALTTVDIPSATEIGNFAFRGCTSLEEINFPNTTTIGQGCFDECISLSSVNFPMLETIAPLSFRKCEAFTAVDLPVVTSIGTQAFYSSGVASLTLRSNTVVTLENADAFYFTPIEAGTGYIYVPSNLVDSYKTADGWSTYANQIRAIV